MITGEIPWSTLPSKSLPSLLATIEQHRMPPLPSNISLQLSDLLIDCFAWESQHRPTAQELLQTQFCSLQYHVECDGHWAKLDSICSTSRRNSLQGLTLAMSDSMTFEALTSSIKFDSASFISALPAPVLAASVSLDMLVKLAPDATNAGTAEQTVRLWHRLCECR